VIRFKPAQRSSANRSVVDEATMGCGNSKRSATQPKAVNDEHAKKTLARTSTILLGDGVQQGTSNGEDEKTHAESSQLKTARIATQLEEVHTFYQDQSPAQNPAHNRKQGRKATPWAKPSDMDVEDDDDDEEEHEEDQQPQQQTDNREKRLVVTDQVEVFTVPRDDSLRAPMRPMSPKVTDVDDGVVSGDLVASSRKEQRKNTPWVQPPESEDDEDVHSAEPPEESIQVMETRLNWWQSFGFCQ